ncbi:MAG: homoserine O-acetyltransferase [Gammaproteobacteria bacterium]|jgi:homoserine O-acetyltransferase
MINNEHYSETVQGVTEKFVLGNFQLQQGATLRGAWISYRTHGTLNAAKNNAILFPHMYSGSHKDMEFYAQNGWACDPEKYFIIFPGQFGNGVSSSPSNTAPPYNMGAFPKVQIEDDVIAQYRLVTEKFGINELQLVTGWSMGAQQTYEWAIRYPEMVKRAAPIAGTAKCTPHDQLFIGCHMEQLRSDSNFNNGFYTDAHACHVGLRRHAQLWSVMGCCTEFYKAEAWRPCGFSSIEDFVQGYYENWFLPMDPNDLLTMAWKWQHGDSSRNTGGALGAALGRIKAKTFVIPFEDDMFFPIKDIESEQKLVPNSELRVIPSLWGHFTMLSMDSSDHKKIDDQLKELLAIEVS